MLAEERNELLAKVEEAKKAESASGINALCQNFKDIGEKAKADITAVEEGAKAQVRENLIGDKSSRYDEAASYKPKEDDGEFYIPGKRGRYM